KEGFCVLILIVIGHLSFFSGALMRGTVLCYVAKLQDAISLQYTISNIILVTSANLTISCAIAAIVLISSTLLLLFCSMELAVSIILTFANKGHALLATCTFANVELIQIPDKPPKWAPVANLPLLSTSESESEEEGTTMRYTRMEMRFWSQSAEPRKSTTSSTLNPMAEVFRPIADTPVPPIRPPCDDISRLLDSRDIQVEGVPDALDLPLLESEMQGLCL
uniref:Uncharacterized protein n=1 Tax=Chrysemys picta bellii TaxID=8478 RepID=A0A8C3FAV0_CHRPI